MAKSTKRKQRVRRSNLKKTVRGSQRLNRAVNNMKTTKKRRVRRVSRKGRKKSRQSGGKTGTYIDAVNLFNKIFGRDAKTNISNIPYITVTQGTETASGKEYMLISNTEIHQAVKFRHHFIGIERCKFKQSLKVYIYASGKGENSVKVPLGFEKKLISLQKDPSASAPQDGLLTPGESGNSLTNIICHTLNIERDKTEFKPIAPDRIGENKAVYETPVVTREPSEPYYVYSEPEVEACKAKKPAAAEVEAEERLKAKEIVRMALAKVEYSTTASAESAQASQESAKSASPAGKFAIYAVPTTEGNPSQVTVKTKDGTEYLVNFPDQGLETSEFEGGTKISVTRTGTDDFDVIREDDHDDSLIVQRVGDVETYKVYRDTHLVQEGVTVYEVPLAVELHSDA